MNRNQAKELMPIIQAYAEGKTIQSRCVKGDTSLWYDDEDPSFDDDFEYRIKPVSKPDVNYRPFANGDECMKEMRKHEPFGLVKKSNDREYNIKSVFIKEGIIYIRGSYVGLSRAFNDYTFADGTPFGVKEEE